MTLYEMTNNRFESLVPTTFEAEGITERSDLQRLLAAQIHVIDPDLLVLCDEFNHWEGTQRRIDLLCIDHQARLVVIELKRTKSGGHMELQALRYAAMISTMTFKEAVESHARYTNTDTIEAENNLVQHIHDDDNIEEIFGSDVRVVLASADFSPELVASVNWLNNRDLDIRCIRLCPFKLTDRIIIQSEQIIPLKDAGTFEFRVRTKSTERRSNLPKSSWTGAWFINVGEDKSSARSWEDCTKYGYISAGGGKKWQDQIQRPSQGDLIFAYINTHGYVGVGTVLGPAVAHKDFIPPNHKLPLIELDLQSPPTQDSLHDPKRCEYCLPINWLATRDRLNAIKDTHRRGTAIRLGDETLVRRLCDVFGIERQAHITP